MNMSKKMGVVTALFLVACAPAIKEESVQVQPAELSEDLPVIPFVSIAFQNEGMLVCNLGTDFYVFKKEETHYALSGSVDVRKTIEIVEEQEYLWEASRDFFVINESGIWITPFYDEEQRPGEDKKIHKADVQYFYSYEEKTMQLMRGTGNGLEKEDCLRDPLTDYQLLQQEAKESEEEYKCVKKEIQSFMKGNEWLYALERFSDQPMKYGVIYDKALQTEDDKVSYLVYDRENKIWQTYELDFE